MWFGHALLLLIPLLSQGARDEEDYEELRGRLSEAQGGGSDDDDEESLHSSLGFAQETHRHRHHRGRRLSLHNGSEEVTEEQGQAPSEEHLKIQTEAKKEPDDCGPLMGHSPEEVREQVLRCLKQRKQQAKVVQESLRKRSKYEMITAAEVDRVEKLAKEIGDVDAMKAAYLNDQEKIKAALVKRKEQMDRQIRRLDQDGQDAAD